MIYERKELTGWLIYSREEAERNRHYINFYLEEGKKQGIGIKLLLAEDINFGVRDNQWYLTYKRKEIGYPDFAIVRMIYPLLSKQLELLEIPVFNSARVSSICNDKARTCQYVAGLHLPVADTEFCKRDFIKEKISTISYPCVIKTVSGHGGKQVFLLEGVSDQAEALPVLESEDTVIQPVIGEKHQDLRVYVIGKRIIAAVLRTAKHGFKSNFSLGGKIELYSLKEAEREIIEKIISAFDFGMVGIDFIIGSQGELIFNEIEDVVGARMLYQLTDINLAGEYLEYIRKRICS